MVRCARRRLLNKSLERPQNLQHVARTAACIVHMWLVVARSIEAITRRRELHPVFVAVRAERRGVSKMLDSIPGVGFDLT